MSFTFQLASYLVEGPISEDGEPIILRDWRVEATDDVGHRWVYSGPHAYWRSSYGYEPPLAAEALRAEFESQKIDPSKSDGWEQDLPVYGSDAWDDEAEFELACEEADAYGQPRPQWR